MSDCHFWELTCKAGEAAAKAGDDIVSKWAEHVVTGVNKTLVSLGTIWVNVKANVGGDESVASFIQERQRWLVIVIAIVSLVFAAMQMAWRQRMEPLQDVQGGLLRLIVVSAAFPTITQLMLEVGDLYSPWIIEQAGSKDDGKFLTKILDMSLFQTGQLGMIMLIVGGLIALLANIVQVFLMFVRSGLLTLLTGFSPLAAAASTTKWGQQWLGKYVAWTMAFVAFKPTASTIYAASLKLLSGDSYSFTDDIGKFLMGIIFLILAIVALPALVMFLVPVTANIGSGGGGVGGMFGGMLATGAVNVANRSMFQGGSSGGGGGGGSSSKPPGQPQSTQAPTGAAPTGAAGGGAGAAGAAGGGASGAAGAGAAGGGAAGAGAAAGGPVGAGIAAGAKVVGAGVGAARSVADQSTGNSGAAPVAAPSIAGPSGAQGGRGSSGGGRPSSGGGSQSTGATGAREVHRR
ncbi:hypothetical protein BKH27_00055 [Actinomyces oris]|uniref:Conjugal transfer protein TrbL n=1 Tax=Actinomyces oris TaxID=544580 RepID=A0A1Q8W2Y3_9ACTO|nr:hypothetical protein [Actinomyces oris]OLO55939.1 hypothetical protein BKH27_00055 [Actinomyces oris]